MKKFYFCFLMLCGAVLLATSCKEESSAELPEFRLGTPVVIEATETTALVSCEAEFDLGAFAGLTKGFWFGSLRASSEADFRSVTATKVEGRTFTCRLTGLTPGEQYNLYGFVGIGSARYLSGAALLETRPGDDPVVTPVFGTPSHANVTENGATIRCSFTYAGDRTITEAYFLCESASGAEKKSNVSATAGEKSATLTDLSPQTTYTYRLYVVIDGASYASAAQSFTTAASQGGGTVTGDTKYPGWPELVPEDASKAGGEYYYAYHMCPDFRVGGRLARNYTVCYSSTHHCPVWVAAPRHKCYESGASRTDAYATDPDIPSGIQYRSKSTGGGCNKGHMLGSAERLATSSVNRQVFYYTNIAPQYSSGFNTGGGGWNLLEDWIDGKVCADTTYVVIGTYFERYTDRYGNAASPKKIEFGGRSDVSCPTMFYYAVLRTKRGNTGKSVRDCSAGELMCAAFVRCHNNALKGKRVSSQDMISIAELEKLTGHTFFVNVPNAPKSTCTASDWGL